MKKRFVLAYDYLVRGLGLLAAMSFAVLALLIGLDIALRNLDLGSLGWLNEIVEYALYACTFMAAPWVLRINGHVRVDLLLRAVSPGVAMWINRVTDSIGLWLSMLIGWYGFRAALDAFLRDTRQYKTFAMPEWWLLAIIPLSMVLLGIAFFLRIRQGMADADSEHGEEGF